MTQPFSEIGRLPLAGDNVAIATDQLEAGTVVRYAHGPDFALSHTILEGHRFAVCDIAAGQPLLSWGLPFGIALAAIKPGAYVCNQGVLESLAGRRIECALPATPNFEDRIVPHELDVDQFHAGRQVTPREDPPVFQGYDRGARGVGTRNTIVILATSSRTAGYARLLAARLQDAASDCANIDGIVAVAHTEGGARDIPNNRDLLLRTLAGFVVHANVAAVLAVDYGSEVINNRVLRETMIEQKYPLKEVLHQFLSLNGDLASQLQAGEQVVRQWLEPVNRMQRSEQPLSELKLALQCGGSDAFSGISGNPLAAWSARELIRCGGSAVLAETDELIGAESYILQNVRDLKTAKQFLHMIARFKERVAWHGSTAEGNPSGGNKLRGLYNIVLKSIGAAAKSHPDVCLDRVIDYAQPLAEPGFYFMDSPGNDLESIAGEVATGCNLIYFVTGNGSVTNFPFVPTIKIVTTTRRYDLLSSDMDVNAGAYLDGVPMDDLGQDLFEKSLDVASGARSRGEMAGHSQVSIWRNWQQQDDSRLAGLLVSRLPDGEPLPIQPEGQGPNLTFKAICSGDGYATDRLGLILPTSLCSGQIARMSAERLNAKELGKAQGVSRFAALVHTEGCGVSGVDHENIYTRMMLGYLRHPRASMALLLEHGCEKTHNDFMRNELIGEGLETDRFGWASVQMDGGIEKVLDRVEAWFADAAAAMAPPVYEALGLEGLRIGLLSSGPVSADVASGLALLTRWIVSAGGTVLVPGNDGLLGTSEYRQNVLGGRAPQASLSIGQDFRKSGFHIMAAPTQDAAEIVTGMGATGVESLLVHVSEHPIQGHPFIPVLQLCSEQAINDRYGGDIDLHLEGDAASWPEQMLSLLVRTAGRDYIARSTAMGNTAFQVTRGLLSVST